MLSVIPTVHAAEISEEEYEESDYIISDYWIDIIRVLRDKISKYQSTADVERYPTVPLFNQIDYPEHAYGKYGTIASHGCGIVSLAMVATYLTDSLQHPVDLAEKYGHYNTEHGSYWSLFENTDQDFGIDMIEECYSWNKTMEALRNGHVVIALQSKGLFTSGGHFIVLTGLTEDGKIMVNDPNGNNWNRNAVMINGFTNGFTEEQIYQNGGPYWIYAIKETNAN